METRERGIIFSAEMVRAILAGRKVQTRRIIKPQPTIWETSPGPDSGREGLIPLCPYEIGTKLWVRETFALYQTVDHIRRSDGRAFSEVSDGQCAYKADGHDAIDDVKQHIRLMSEASCEDVVVDGDKWKPSIHMFRRDSRINLLVKDIRVERVQDISEGDADAEGIPENANSDTYSNRPLDPEWCPSCRGEGVHGALGANLGMTEVDCEDCDTSVKLFRNLWDRINGAPKPVKAKGVVSHYTSYPWEDIQETREHRGLPWHVHGNPHVFAYTFEVKKSPI